MKRIFTRALQLTLASALTLLTHTVLSQGSGYALNFDGTDDFIEIPNNSSMNIGANDFAVEFWVKFNTLASNQLIINRWNEVSATERGYTFLLNASGQLELWLREPAMVHTYPVTSAPPIELDRWYHVAFTRNNSEVAIYLDGNEVYAPTPAAFTLDDINGTEVLIGKYSANVFFGQSSIEFDELRIWTKGLDIVEIRENMCQKLSGTEPDLAAYFRMDEGIDNSCSGGEDVCDLTGNGNHGTKF